MTTPTYSDAKVRTKAAAGFRCYHMQADGSLAAEFKGHEIRVPYDETAQTDRID